MRIFSEDDVGRLIDRPFALAAAEAAFRLHSAGRALAPGRIDLRRDAPRLGALTLAVLDEDGMLGVKTNVHSHPGPGAFRQSASLMTLWDAKGCRPLALIATTAFNRHRTAAGFGAACRLLAPPAAATLAIFGAGQMAPEAIRYLAAVRPIRRVLIVGRTAVRAEALARQARDWPEFSAVAVEVERDPAAAAGQADIIAAITNSDTPVFPGAAVRPGTFVILGGANRPAAREADDDLIGRAAVYVDHLDGCIAQAGDLRLPLATGVLDRSRIIGEIGAMPPAPPAHGLDVTVFKSIGIATQDLVLARRLVERAGTSAGFWFDPQTGETAAADGMASRSR